MNKTIGGILLVSGTTVGAGMLALPVVTGFAGFIPALFMFIAYWAFMTYTALLILEVNLYVDKRGANMIAMAKATLGIPGQVIAWAAYLFLLYALTTAYLAGGGPIFNQFLLEFAGLKVPKFLESIPLLLVFGFFVYRGAHTVDWINRVLMVALVGVYLFAVYWLYPHVDASLLRHAVPSLLWVGSSVAATSFGFHIIIPTLTEYLERDLQKLKRVILLGSAIPLFVYLIWEALVLGIIPLEGPVSITQGYLEGSNGAALLSAYLGKGILADLLRVFLLIAIVTSFLGVSTSLTDFLSDGFNIKKTPMGKASLLLLTFGPPLVIAATDPRAFLTALEYAGAFGVIILLGVLPALMAWRGRIRFDRNGTYRAPGGDIAIFISVVISLFVILIEILQKIGVLWIKSGS